MFKPGDEVVCVDADLRPRCVWVADVPKEGAHYTVVDVLTVRDPLTNKPALGLVLAEIKNGWRESFAFAARRFRKVQKRSTETGMSILRGIADGTRKPERERA